MTKTYPVNYINTPSTEALILPQQAVIDYFKAHNGSKTDIVSLRDACLDQKPLFIAIHKRNTTELSTMLYNLRGISLLLAGHSDELDPAIASWLYDIFEYSNLQVDTPAFEMNLSHEVINVTVHDLLEFATN